MRVREPGAGMLLLAALAAVVVFALASPPAVPPPVIPASAAAGTFSAERARVHLRELTRSPRPVGSAAHAEARAYLLDALRQLGLEPELQHAIGLRRTGSTFRVAALVNVMARLPGVASSGAVVLLAHYDSVPNSPGAGDAGNGVAAILETVRALRAGPPLRNDVIVLLTDAEEVGLLGAQAYVDEHPWAADTGIVLNAEGRGHAGPVHMFRTSANNGLMIRTLGRAVPHPAAESLANELFRLMPNDTDLTVFQQAGHAGMDFANVRSLTHYHTPLDAFENADPRTLQHHGEYLLSLAQAFGAMDLEQLAAPDRIYFTVPMIGLLHYPLAWALPLALLAMLLVAGVTARAGRRKLLRAKGVGIALLHLAGALVVLPLCATLAWRVLAGLLPEVDWSWHGSPYDSGRYVLGIGLLVIALFVASAAWLHRRMSPPEMLAAALIAWSVLSLASAWRLPGASYLFLWPLVFMTAGFEAWSAEADRRRAGRAALVALLALPTLLFIPALVAGMEEALTLAWIAAPMALLVLALGLLALPLSLVSRGLGRALPASLAVLGVAVLGLAIHGAGIDAERKKTNSVHYIADLDRQDARWYSLDPAPDQWTSLYLGDAPERAALPGWAPTQLAGPEGIAWQRQAPVMRVAGPRAELLAETPTTQGRRLRLRISAPADSHHITIRFAGKAEVSELSIDGRDIPVGPDRDSGARQLLYFAMPEGGIELEATTVGTEPLRVYLRANILGLPPTADGAAPVRPDHMMPAGLLGDLSRLQRTFEF